LKGQKGQMWGTMFVQVPILSDNKYNNASGGKLK
jgi:hypothetical protein